MPSPPTWQLKALCLLVLYFGAAGLVARAGPETALASNDYVSRVWDTDDGLPQNGVTGIVQTADGYLWVATQSGLVRFDGVRFTSFRKGTTEGLESSYARAVATDKTGALWIGLERGGVARMQNGRFETILSVAPPAADTRWASSFAEDAEGSVWIGMAPDQCVYRWKAGQLTKLTADDGVGAGEDTFVHADSDGRIWFATKKTCGVFDGTRFQPIDPEGGDRVHLAPAREGGMWATRGQKLLHYSSDGTRREVADIAWLGGALEVNALYEDHEGTLWIATRGAGLLRFRAGSFAAVIASRQAVNTVFEGRDGNLWAGTSAGLYRLRLRRFFLRGVEHGIEKEGVHSLCVDTDGQLWLAVRDSAPVRASSPANQYFTAPEGWTGGAMTTICPDPAGGIWIGYDGGSLQHWKDGVFTRAGSGQRVATLLSDRAGNVWAGTMRAGLIRMRDGKEYPEPTDRGFTLVRALAEDSAGGIWAGTDDGLVFRREKDQFVRVALPGSKGGEAIRFLVPDGDQVWIGARESGLYCWRNGQVERLMANAGLSAQDLRALVIEPDGGFWLASSGTLFRTTRKDLDDVLAGRQRLLRGATYGRADGLPKLGFAFGRRNAAARTPDGRLWFATDRGALEVDPAPLQDSPPLGPTILEEVLVDGHQVPLVGAKALRIPPNPGPIQFRFTLPRLGSPERMRFHYRLVGLEKEWTTAQEERVATYARLPAGSYRFEVFATEGEGSGMPAPTATMPFSIQAAWWQTASFRVLTGALGAIGLAALVRFIVLRRVRARIRLLEQQNALERERVRIARDMHDNLGASLTRIALMSDLAAGEPEMKGTAARQLDEIAQAARAVSGTLDQIVWTVNPRNDTLERLVGYLGEFAGEYLAPTGLEFSQDLPAEIPFHPVPAEIRHAVLLATKEALNNVVKHAHAHKVWLKVRIAGQVMEIVIRDDGCGFQQRMVGAFSNGLVNIQQRLQAVGGSADVESQPAQGTEVSLRLPIPGS